MKPKVTEVIVTLHALERILERWQLKMDNVEKFLTEVLQNGKRLAVKKRGKAKEYLIQYQTYYVVIQKRKKELIVITVTRGSPPISWAWIPYTIKNSPIQGKIKLILP